MSVLDIGGQLFVSGLFWMERGNAASVARNARPSASPGTSTVAGRPARRRTRKTSTRAGTVAISPVPAHYCESGRLLFRVVGCSSHREAFPSLRCCPRLLRRRLSCVMYARLRRDGARVRGPRRSAIRVCGSKAGRDLGRAAGRNGAVRSATQWRYYRAGDRGEPTRRPGSRIEHWRHERGGVGRKRIDEGNAA